MVPANETGANIDIPLIDATKPDLVSRISKLPSPAVSGRPIQMLPSWVPIMLSVAVVPTWGAVTSPHATPPLHVKL